MRSPDRHAGPVGTWRNRLWRPARRWASRVGWVWVCTRALCGPEVADDLPIAPILAESDGSGRVRLSSPRLTADIDAARGRVVAIRVSSQTIVDGSASVGGASPDPVPDWQRSAGIWVWPVPEPAWADLRGRGYYPEQELDRATGTARAWRARSGAAVLKWTRELGPPLCLRETRTWRVSPFTATLTLDVELERIRPSSTQVGAWILVRLQDCQRLVWPADDSAESPAEVIAFHRPPAFAWTREPGSVVYRPDLGGVHRFKANDASRAWIAAESAGHVLLLREHRPAATQPPPLRVWVYVGNSGRRTELELMDAGLDLKPGERWTRSVALDCFPIMAGLDARSFALRVRLLAGEKEAASLP